MEIEHRRVFGVMAVLAIFLVSIAISQSFNTEQKASNEKIRKEKIKKLHFTGKVISYKTYKYFRKDYYLICVKLDIPSVPDLYVYNDMDCIKIKHGIATFSAGYLNKGIGKVKAVSVNLRNNGKLIFYYYGTWRDELQLQFSPMGLKEDDMNTCN